MTGEQLENGEHKLHVHNSSILDLEESDVDEDGITYNDALEVGVSSTELLIWNPVKLLQCCGAVDDGRMDFSRIPAIVSDRSSDLEDAMKKLLRSQSGRGVATDIKHIRQCTTWDCGIVCIQMALRWLRESAVDDISKLPCSSHLSPLEVIERKMLLQKVNTKSVWTVDLILLLENLLLAYRGNDAQPNHENTTYLFGSEVWGVNSSHSTTGYYQKTFDEDSIRIMKLCQEITERNLPILCPFHLEFEFFLKLISFNHCIAIVLVDNLILMKSKNDCNDDVDERNGERWDKNEAYVGHYVIVCGISRDPDHLVEAYTHDEVEASQDEATELTCLVVVNPGIGKRVMYAKPSRLELAWRADGTDCDVIFIAKHTTER